MANSNTGHAPALMFFHIPLPEYASTYFATSEKYDTVASASVNSHLLSSLIDAGDVKAVFVGHDRLNEYCALREGVQLCFGGGAGFGLAYGNSTFPRRARVIEWLVDDFNLHMIHTWSRHHGNLSERHHSQVLHSDPGYRTYNDVSIKSSVTTSHNSKKTSAMGGSTVGAVVAVIVGLGILYWWKFKRVPSKEKSKAVHAKVAPPNAAIASEAIKLDALQK